MGNFWWLIPEAQALLADAVHDPHPRVRLEAVRGLSFLGNAQAAEQALQVVEHDMDYWIEYTLEQTLNALQPVYQPLVASEQFLAARRTSSNASSTNS